MGEATFQLDLLGVCYSEARKQDGTHYQKRLWLLTKLGIVEHQYRQARSYTLAQWTRNLLHRCRNSDNIGTVLQELREYVEQPPASNTGVNPPMPLPMGALEAVEYGV